jgi:hypothetical protein
LQIFRQRSAFDETLPHHEVEITKITKDWGKIVGSKLRVLFEQLGLGLRYWPTMKKPTGGSSWSNLWLSAEPFLGLIRYSRSSILDPRSLF